MARLAAVGEVYAGRGALMRASVVIAGLSIGCAGRGEAPARRVEDGSHGESGRIQYGMCVGYAGQGGSPVFERGQALLRQADVDYRADRDEVAALGFLAAAAAFREASVADPKFAAARTNMRIAYADAALAWLRMARSEEARAALAQALAEDPDKQADWQRAIDGLPKPPHCAFALEPVASEPVESVESPGEPMHAVPVEPPAPVVYEACGEVERGEPRRKHEFIGETMAGLDERGGEILCGQGPIWQLRFGTLCGDMASFHKVITVEVRAGKVTRVWERERYNTAFCASQF